MEVPVTVVWALGLVFAGQLGANIVGVAILFLRVGRLEQSMEQSKRDSKTYEKWHQDWRHNEFQPLENLVNRHDEYLARVKKKINGGD